MKEINFQQSLAAIGITLQRKALHTHKMKAYTFKHDEVLDNISKHYDIDRDRILPLADWDFVANFKHNNPNIHIYQFNHIDFVNRLTPLGSQLHPRS